MRRSPERPSGVLLQTASVLVRPFLCGVFQIGQFSGRCWRILLLMRMIDMTPAMFLSVACPTCGVAIGSRCLLSAGGLRSESHLDRKLRTAEAAEQHGIRPIRTRKAISARR